MALLPSDNICLMGIDESGELRFSSPIQKITPETFLTASGNHYVVKSFCQDYIHYATWSGYVARSYVIYRKAKKGCTSWYGEAFDVSIHDPSKQEYTSKFLDSYCGIIGANSPSPTRIPEISGNIAGISGNILTFTSGEKIWMNWGNPAKGFEYQLDAFKSTGTQLQSFAGDYIRPVI